MDVTNRHDLRQIVIGLLEGILKTPVATRISDQTGASDIPGWDSLNHLKLLVALETRFDIRFGGEDLEDPENFGQLVDLVAHKRGSVG